MESARRKVGLVLLCAIAFGGGAYLIYVLLSTSGAARVPALILAKPGHGTRHGAPLGLVLGGGGSGVQVAGSPTRSAGQSHARWAAPAQADGESSPASDDQSQPGSGVPAGQPQGAPHQRDPDSPPSGAGSPAPHTIADPVVAPNVTPTPAQGQPTPSPSPSPTPTPGPSPNPTPTPAPTPPTPTPPTPTPPSGPGFSIAVAEGGGALYPGAAPQALALTVGNPSGAEIYVTSLSVNVPSGPPGCDPATNVGVLQSDVSSAAPLEVPAHGSVTLPAQGRSAPAIQLLDLPINQDACENARFLLSFTGSAHS
jgi:hypothetical protein